MELRIFVDEVTYSREADQLSIPSSIETVGGWNWLERSALYSVRSSSTEFGLVDIHYYMQSSLSYGVLHSGDELDGFHFLVAAFRLVE